MPVIEAQCASILKWCLTITGISTMSGNPPIDGRWLYLQRLRLADPTVKVMTGCPRGVQEGQEAGPNRAPQARIWPAAGGLLCRSARWVLRPVNGPPGPDGAKSLICEHYLCQHQQPAESPG
jgi:hypothetical protein